MTGENSKGSTSSWVVLAAHLCAASALGACAARPTAKPDPAPAQATSTAAKSDVQCRTERVTGSLVATRLCTTAAQREAISRSTQDARDSMNKALVPPDCPSGGSCH